METAYFKTPDPSQKTYLTAFGRWVAWTKISPDLGLLVTNNPKAIADLRSLIRQGSGAVFEISAQEYADLEAKKKDQNPPPKQWREEFSIRRQPGQTHSPASISLAKGDVADTEPAKVNPLNRTPLPDNLRPKAR